MEIKPATAAITEITAADGKMLTNGVITAKAVFLPPSASTQDWREIDEAEAPQSPPVRYSKYKIQLKAQALGVWEALKAAIQSAGLSDSWSNINDLASDNPELLDALPAIKAAFPAVDVDEFLSECEAQM